MYSIFQTVLVCSVLAAPVEVCDEISDVVAVEEWIRLQDKLVPFELYNSAPSIFDAIGELAFFHLDVAVLVISIFGLDSTDAFDPILIINLSKPPLLVIDQWWISFLLLIVFYILLYIF